MLGSCVDGCGVLTPAGTQEGTRGICVKEEEEALQLEEDVLNQRKEALRHLQREVERLESSGVQALAQELRAAEAEVVRLGGYDEVLRSLKAHQRKEELLQGMLVESEKRIETLSRDKKNAEARVLAAVNDMVELERGVHVELWRTEAARDDDASADHVRPMVAHERKIAALQRQIRTMESDHEESLARQQRVVPLKMKSQITDLERQLAESERELKRAKDTISGLDTTVRDLKETVASLEGDVVRLQQTAATAATAALLREQLAAADKTIEALRGDMKRLQSQLEAASAVSVQQEAVACSLQFENLSLKEVLDATDVRVGGLMSAVGQSWSQLRKSAMHNTLEQLDITLESDADGTVVMSEQPSQTLSLVELAPGRAVSYASDARRGADGSGGDGFVRMGGLVTKLDEAENMVREMSGFALEACARAERDGYHSKRAGSRLEGDVSVLRRRVAELECDLAEAEGLVSSLKEENAALREDVNMRNSDENELWRLVRGMERSIQGGEDFDGVVSSLLAGEDVFYVCRSLIVCGTGLGSIKCCFMCLCTGDHPLQSWCPG